MVSTISFPAIVGTADMMLKSATVRLVGYEKVGNGFCTAIVRGQITDVRMAVEAGAETAKEFGQLVSTIVIPRPYPNLEAILPISTRLSQLTDGRYSRLSNQAIGLLETRGFPAMVGAADMMLKSSDVHLAGYETIGAGLCTAIIRGNVADVAIAIEAGMYEAERIGEFHTLMIIPRPLDDLEETLPTSEYWIETPIPVNIPMMALQQQEQELVQLPNLEIAEVETIPLNVPLNDR
ncbi:BMC domain-containing protein [Pseudanabaena sp. FACHB-723]|uniref:BMC domain-containing protein n=2 Tax=Pseudanabaena mucicola TaxID=71190 RepID=A0ABR7ZU28_9CYAN|nr:BMC domain-containing protein [Pseudanabaena mucicola FACHB-723]